MSTPRIAAVVPTYNNARTIAAVVEAVRAHLPDIIVVNDGSTDETASVLQELQDIDIITVDRNRGKGHALRLAFSHAWEREFTHVVTIDADGQHLADDIPLFVEAVRRAPETLYIGNRTLPVDGTPQPARSRFGARFGSFWYKFHTGLRVDDTQCGFRAYPLDRVRELHCRTNRYEFEIEILIEAAWARIPVEQIPIHIFYQPREERVSHFRPLRDFGRISVVNSKAAMTRIFMPWRFVDAPGASTAQKIRFLIIKELTAHHSPGRAAAALALGACIGLMPIYGFQVLTVIGLSLILRLNRTLAFLGVTISSPPLLPFWIAAGYWIGTLVFPAAAISRSARWAAGLGLNNISNLLTTDSGAGAVFTGAVQWAIGSVIMALVVGSLVFAVSLPLFQSYDKLKARDPAKADRA